jgi:hypothetical protein
MIENIISQIILGVAHIMAFFCPIAFPILVFPEIRAAYLWCYMIYLRRKGIYPMSGSENMEAVRLLIDRGHIIMAMRCYCKVTNAKLKDAKMYVKTGMQKAIVEDTFSKKFIGKIFTAVFFIFRWYVLVVAIPIAVSWYFSNEILFYKNERAMDDAGCHTVPSFDIPNWFKPWEYYFHFDYWNADYRGHIISLETERCVLKIMSLLQESDNDASAAFVDDKGQRFFILKSKKFSTKQEE